MTMILVVASDITPAVDKQYNTTAEIHKDMRDNPDTYEKGVRYATHELKPTYTLETVEKVTIKKGDLV